jgi:hypothetical protein
MVLRGHIVKQYGHSNSLAFESIAGGGEIETRSPLLSHARIRNYFVDMMEASSSSFTWATSSSVADDGCDGAYRGP